MDRAEVKWRIRRSTLELDILLHRFFHQHYDDLSEKDKKQFQEWLLLEDHQWQDLLKSSNRVIFGKSV